MRPYCLHNLERFSYRKRWSHGSREQTNAFRTDAIDGHMKYRRTAYGQIGKTMLRQYNECMTFGLFNRRVLVRAVCNETSFIAEKSTSIRDLIMPPYCLHN